MSNEPLRSLVPPRSGFSWPSPAIVVVVFVLARLFILAADVVDNGVVDVAVIVRRIAVPSDVPLQHTGYIGVSSSHQRAALHHQGLAAQAQTPTVVTSGSRHRDPSKLLLAGIPGAVIRIPSGQVPASGLDFPAGCCFVLVSFWLLPPRSDGQMKENKQMTVAKEMCFVQRGHPCTLSDARPESSCFCVGESKTKPNRNRRHETRTEP